MNNCGPTMFSNKMTIDLELHSSMQVHLTFGFIQRDCAYTNRKVVWAWTCTQNAHVCCLDGSCIPLCLWSACIDGVIHCTWCINVRSIKSCGIKFSSFPSIVSRPINSLFKVGSRWTLERILNSICLRIDACRPYNISNSFIFDLNSSRPLYKTMNRECQAHNQDINAHKIQEKETPA